MPVASTKKVIMLRPLNILAPLWRLCMNLLSYKSLPGGTAGLQIRRAEFDPLAACHKGKWSSGLDARLQIWSRGFDSRFALQAEVVVPPQLSYAPMGLLPS